MRLRLLSDIHLESGKNSFKYKNRFILNDTSDILLLAGDIGNPTFKHYKSFLSEISKYYAKVFVITGNHEYYQGLKFNKGFPFPKYRYPMEDVDELVERITTSLPNVHFLQRKSMIYNRIRFLGCTLWSIVDSDKLYYDRSDYKMIPNMTAENSTNLCKRDSTWLQEQLQLNNSDYDHTVVMTHYLPSYKLISNKYTCNSLNSFYASNLDHVVEKADIWVCGHSHTANHVIIGQCRCYLNPVGYNVQISGYNSNLEIKISESLCE
jgi:predicted phosphohydrolase